MSYHFEELNQTTRKWMHKEFLGEENSRHPYRSKKLSPLGLQAFPKLMENAILNGNEVTLAQSLSNPSYWNSKNPSADARRLADTEFNTWYVRGFARRLIDEGEEYCQVYRAADSGLQRIPDECIRHENQIYPVKTIYEGHRVRYWPTPGNPNALSIPCHPNCRHTIRSTR